MGIAVFPSLHETPDGRYRLGLRLDPTAARTLISRIEPAMEVAGTLAAAPGTEPGGALHRRDVWSEQADGSFCFGEITATHQPLIFDGAGGRFPDGVRIGHGTTLRVSMELDPYVDRVAREYGVRLVLRAVQVIDPRPWSETRGWGPDRIRRAMESLAERAAVERAPKAGQPAEEEGAIADRAARPPRATAAGTTDPPVEGLIRSSTGWVETVRPTPGPALASPTEAPGESGAALAEVVRTAVAEALADALAALAPASAPMTTLSPDEPESSGEPR